MKVVKSNHNEISANGVMIAYWVYPTQRNQVQIRFCALHRGVDKWQVARLISWSCEFDSRPRYNMLNGV